MPLLSFCRSASGRREQQNYQMFSAVHGTIAKVKASLGDENVMMPNGTQRAKVVPRKQSLAARSRASHIAAIDFGTKNCSLAYITANDSVDLTQGVPKLPINGTHLRVPTAILFDGHGAPEAFGHDARTLYGNLEDHERESYFYFEEIKMKLQRDQEVNREMTVEALNGKKFFLVDIIAQILHFLKQEFIVAYLQRGGHQLSALDFDWVITVPAIWRARGKQMMREAGYMAGLCSEVSCSNLQVAGSYIPEVRQEASPHRLSLALEPESAAVYCHEMLKRQLIAPYCKNAPVSTSTMPMPGTYIIVDIGGGTVDITAHRVVRTPKPCLEELHHPVGNSCGGSRINQEFAHFVETLVCDVGFSRYIETCDPEVNLRNRYDLNRMINVTFEEQKLMFCRLERDKRREVVIRLPRTLVGVYVKDLEEGIETIGGSDVRLVRYNLRISPRKMDAIMQPVLTGILNCIADLLVDISAHIEVLYLVGGFGGSPYMYEKIQGRFGDQCQCIVPLNPEFAVVEGASLFQSDPSIIHARRADATYGRSVIRPFQEKIHNSARRLVDDDGVLHCRDLFQTILSADEAISPCHVYTCISMPLSHLQTNMHVELFSSTEKAEDVWYTTGRRSGNATKIGELTVAMPSPSGDKQREVEFTFDFSHTEIQVVGHDKSSGTEVKMVLDFLSAHCTS